MTENGRVRQDHRRDILFAFALALAAYMAWLLRDVLVTLYVAALFAVVLAPLVRFTSHLHIGRRQIKKVPAVLLLIAIVAAALGTFGYLAIPPVVHDLNQLSTQAPSKLPELVGKLYQIPFVDRMDAPDLTDKLQSAASRAAGYILKSAGGLASGLLGIVTGIVLTIYFILEGRRAYRWFLSFVPPARRERLDETLQRAAVRMGRWLLGQASLMLILGLASTAVYAMLHIRYAYTLGVLTGLLNFIPVLGAAATISLVLIVAAVDSWGRVAGVAIFYIIYLNLENSYLVPRIMKSRVDLPGLGILVALLIGFALAGVVGSLVAVPTAVLVAVLLDEYLVWKDRRVQT